MYKKLVKEEETPEAYASRLLKNKIFSGIFMQRKLMEFGPQAVYKDEILVHESEHDLCECLRRAKEVFKIRSPELLTTCIKKDGWSQYTVWTNLYGCAFGPHWFQIKSVKVEQNMVNFTIKRLRSIHPKQMYPIEKIEPSKSSKPFIDWSTFSIDPDMLKNISDFVSKENLKQSLRFVSVVLLAIIVGFYQLLLLLFQLLHELNFLFRSMIPFFVACVESLTKAFGGLLILIAMMWRTPEKTLRQTRFPMRAIRPVYVSDNNENISPQRTQR